MKLILLHEAEMEFWESVEHYERRHPGLGVRFKEEVDRYLERIRVQPLLPPLRKAGYRRVNLTVFRHYIAYVVREDMLSLGCCDLPQPPRARILAGANSVSYWPSLP